MTAPLAQEFLFAGCAPGLEPFVLRELATLGMVRRPAENSPEDPGQGESGRMEAGGVSFTGTLEDVVRANLMLRCAGRILIRMPAFQAATFSKLKRKTSRLPWERYLGRGHSIAFRAACHKSRLYHSGAVAGRVAEAIGDRLGFPLPQKPWDEEAATDGLQLILIRLVRDICVISIDTSGPHLHRRGYRLAVAKAPLRETLACAMLYASGWDRTAPLVDPFCGSGTIAIEAALYAQGIPPGHARRFAFMNWPGFDSAVYNALLTGLPKGPPLPEGGIVASDRDAGAVAAARENAKRWRMSHAIRLSVRPLSALVPPPGTGWMVSNPPFGIRTGSRNDLRNLYARLGKILEERCCGWQVTLLGTDPILMRNTKLSFDAGIPVLHGGKRVRIFRAAVGPSFGPPGPGGRQP